MGLTAATEQLEVFLCKLTIFSAMRALKDDVSHAISALQGVNLHARKEAAPVMTLIVQDLVGRTCFLGFAPLCISPVL